MWVRSFLSLCNSEEDLHKAAKQATMLSVYDALPVAEVRLLLLVVSSVR